MRICSQVLSPLLALEIPFLNFYIHSYFLQTFANNQMKLRIKLSTLLIEQKEERVALYLHGQVWQSSPTLVRSHTSHLSHWYIQSPGRTKGSVRHKSEHLLWVTNIGKFLYNPQRVHAGSGGKDEAGTKRQEGKSYSPLWGPEPPNKVFR